MCVFSVWPVVHEVDMCVVLLLSGMFMRGLYFNPSSGWECKVEAVRLCLFVLEFDY